MKILSKKDALPKILSSKKLAISWRLELIEDEIQFEGKPSFRYARVSLPPSTIALARRESDGKIALVRQYRHGARDFFWELPAGYIERGERPIDCAKREFREEVGYELLRAKKIGAFYLQPSRSNQIVHIFEGEIGKFRPKNKDEIENIECRFFSPRKAWSLLDKRRGKSSIMHVLAFHLSSEKKRKRAPR